MDDLVASRRAKEKDGGRKEGEQNWNGERSHDGPIARRARVAVMSRVNHHALL